MPRLVRPVQSWFPPAPGNLLGRVPAAVAVVVALGSLERRAWPENQHPPGSWLHDAAALDQRWLYGPVRVAALAYIAGLTPKRVERVLGRLRAVGLVASYRPEGWSTRNGVFYEIRLPMDNAVQRLAPSQVRARERARIHQEKLARRREVQQELAQAGAEPGSEVA